jgi:hypothetical protein
MRGYPPPPPPRAAIQKVNVEDVFGDEVKAVKLILRYR